MAAKLKKRAMAEFSHVIQEEPKPPPQKKLRLVHKTKPPEPSINLSSAANSQEVLHMLLAFAQTLPISAELVDSVLQMLMEHFGNDKESYVRVKIASLLGDLAKTPGFDATSLIDSVISMLKSEESHKVSAQLINTLSVIGQAIPQETRLHRQLIKIAIQHLSDTNHLVRSNCLELIGCLGTPDYKSENSPDEVNVLLMLLREYLNDQDPRTRTSALSAMLMWHQRNIRLDQSVYSQAGLSLSDDNEAVRTLAVRLVWVLSQLYPENVVTMNDQDLRLVDDGFAKICNMMNDLSFKVRAEAAGLLGSLHLVSQKFLEQTLDKKLMSDMRRKGSAHERQKEHFQSGEWSSGNKWADDRPKEDVNPDAVSLMSSGACGAFVHGLEDEFLEVRNAAVDSLCELASQSSSFANLSQDFLVDMFNDEIESVRLNAINSLRKISHHLVLREDQVDIILGVLKDFNFDIREALREMFCCVTLGTKACLYTCILGFLDNMKRYPQDRVSIWKCMQALGKKHPNLVLPLVADLLSSHPYFDVPEPDMDDPAYISILIMVFNATVDMPTMLTLFPEHTFRHYTYLLDTLPEFVPHVQFLTGSQTEVSSDTALENVNAKNFLDETIQRLKKLDMLDSISSTQLLKMTMRDLERIHKVDSKLSSTAECLSLCTECLLHWTQLSNHQWTGLGTCSVQQTNALPAVEKILSITQNIEGLFLGLTTAELAFVRQMRLRAQSVQLLLCVRGSNNVTVKQSAEAFCKRLQHIQSFLSECKVQPEAFTETLLSDLTHLESGNVNEFVKTIQKALTQNKKCTIVKLASHVRKARAVITEPTEASDNPLKFSAGLTVATDLDVMIENVEDLQSVRIQLQYPDMQTQYSVPQMSHFRQMSPLRHRLVSQVLLSHAVWSEPSYVELSVGMCSNRDSDSDAFDKIVNSNSKERLDFIQLCSPVKVYISPKPGRR